MSIKQPKILCTGLLCLDIVTYCNKYPLEDTDNRADDQEWLLGGNATNNVTILTKLGINAQLLTVLTDDYTLNFVKTELGSLKIDSSFCYLRKNARLPVSMVVVSEATGSRTIIHQPGRESFVEPTFSEFLSLFKSDPQITWCHFEGRNFAEVRKMINYLNEQNERSVKISVEIEKRYDGIESLIKGAHYVFLSKSFAQTRGFHSMQEAVVGVYKKDCDFKTDAVICGWGDIGASAYLNNGQLIEVPAVPPSTGVIDTLGAGDTFIASVLSSLMKGHPVKESMQFGCKIAGQKCGVKSLKAFVPSL